MVSLEGSFVMGSMLAFLGRDMAVDLGTANTLVYVRGRGIALNEPSVVALNTDTGKIVAVGVQAKRMIGRTPGNIVAIGAEGWCYRRLRRHRADAALLHPEGAPAPAPRQAAAGGGRAERDHRRGAKRGEGSRAPGRGPRRVYVIEEPMAAAIGAGLAVHEPLGNMVVDVGGGTTEVAVISLGGIVASESIRVGGDEMDQAIIVFAKKEYSLMLGERTAEEIKMAIGAACPSPEEPHIEIRGRDLVERLAEDGRHFWRGGPAGDRRTGQRRRGHRRHARWRSARPSLPATSWTAVSP